MPDATLVAWVGVAEGGIRAAASPPALAEAVRRYRPDLLPEGTPPRALYHILHHELGKCRIQLSQLQHLKKCKFFYLKSAI